jgi:hypothetical protein
VIARLTDKVHLVAQRGNRRLALRLPTNLSMSMDTQDTQNACELRLQHFKMAKQFPVIISGRPRRLALG